MAKSPAHRFGQIIGDLLEDTLIKYCRPIANEYGLFLDYKHPRDARNGQNEVRWTDINGNTHKLDIVIEQDGNEQKFGKPRAFIEMAWRRYTKHSKNKAQEISAAIKPLVAKYNESSPFYGAVLAGEFTENSLNQMKSEGFQILYFSMEAIEYAFAIEGINAHWDEDTSEEDLQDRVEQVEALTSEQLEHIGQELMTQNEEDWNTFVRCLRSSIERKIETVKVATLFGLSCSFDSVEEACEHIAKEKGVISFDDKSACRYEIQIIYSNGELLDMKFTEKRTVLAKLNQLIQ